MALLVIQFLVLWYHHFGLLRLSDRTNFNLMWLWWFSNNWVFGLWLCSSINMLRLQRTKHKWQASRGDDSPPSVNSYPNVNQTHLPALIYVCRALYFLFSVECFFFFLLRNHHLWSHVVVNERQQSDRDATFKFFSFLLQNMPPPFAQPGK